MCACVPTLAGQRDCSVVLTVNATTVQPSVDDSVITAKVKAAVLGEPGLKVSEINVETFKGVVQLSGFVSSRDDIKSAIRVASAVDGVKTVKNDMQLKD